MRHFTSSICGLLLSATACPAFADTSTPPPAVTISGTVTLVSDYRFRGVSQSDITPAVQGSIAITHKSGFYVSVWGSTVDGYVIADGRAHQEIDLIAGYKTTIAGTTFDIGALYYFYPHARFAGDTSKSDFFDPYVAIAHAFGPATGKVTANFAPKQKGLALDQGLTSPIIKHDNLYLAGDLTVSIPTTPLGVSAHLGHTFGPSWLATDATGKQGYSDWGLGATYSYKSLTIGVNYVDTDARFVSLTGKNVSEGGVFGSIGVAF